MFAELAVLADVDEALCKLVLACNSAKVVPVGRGSDTCHQRTVRGVANDH